MEQFKIAETETHYLIHYIESGSVFLQRKAPQDTGGGDLNFEEKIICDLCKKLLRIKHELQEYTRKYNN
jgi:hypothetical protein